MWPVKILQDAIDILQAAMDRIDKHNAKAFDNPRNGGVYSVYFGQSIDMPPVGGRRASAADALIEEMIKDLRAFQQRTHSDDDFVEFSAKQSYLKYFITSDDMMDLSLGEDA